MSLKDKVAIVTGGGRNIGAEIARLFASKGAKVAIVDMDEGRAQTVIGEIQTSNGPAMAVIADISKSDQVKSMVKTVVDHWGKIDILINNVAYSDNKTLMEITEQEWDKTLAISLTAPFLVAKYVAQQMIDQGQGGNIINIGSTSGHRGRPSAIAYTAAKAGVLNLTRSMAIQLAPYDIRVNSISPNRIGSPVGKEHFDPDRKVVNLKGKPGHPIEVARAAYFLVSEDSDFIFGIDILVDGGCTVMGGM